MQDNSNSILEVFRSLTRALSAILPYALNLGKSDIKKEVTEQYPDPISSRTFDELPNRSRGLLYNDIEKCTGCRDCSIACPTKCIEIYLETEGVSEKQWVSVFDIDFSKCIFCGLCAQVCQPASLKHTRQFESAVYLPQDLIAHFGRGRVTVEQREKWNQLRLLREET